MDTFEEIVAYNLTELRKNARLTQAELAEKINYSDKSVSKWERGEALPDLKVLTRLAELFGVSIDYFVTKDAEKQKKEFDFPKSEKLYRIGVELFAACAVWLAATAVFSQRRFTRAGSGWRLCGLSRSRCWCLRCSVRNGISRSA